MKIAKVRVGQTKPLLKKFICLALIFLLSINSFAAIVSDNDGSAFVTKAEFDALKNNFTKQVNDYNSSIDGKIDGAIAQYLAGLISAQVERWDTGNYSMLSKNNLVFTNEMAFPDDFHCDEKLLWRPKYKIFTMFMWSLPLGTFLLDETDIDDDYNVEIEDFYRVRKVPLEDGKSGGPGYELQGIGYFKEYEVVYNFNQFASQYSSPVSGYANDSISAHVIWNNLASKTHYSTQNGEFTNYDLGLDINETLLTYKDKTVQLKTGNSLDFYSSSLFQWGAQDVWLNTSATWQKDNAKSAYGDHLYNSAVPIDHVSDLISDTNVPTTISMLYVGNGEAYIPTVDEEGMWISTYDGHVGFLNKRIGADRDGTTYFIGKTSDSRIKSKVVTGVYLPPYGATHEDGGTSPKNNWWENSLIKAKRFFLEIPDTQTGTPIRVYPTDGFYIGTSPSAGNLELHILVDHVEPDNVVFFRNDDIEDDDYDSTTKNLKLSDGTYYKSLVTGDNVIKINEIKKDDKFYFRFTNKTSGGRVNVTLTEWVTGSLYTSV